MTRDQSQRLDSVTGPAEMLAGIVGIPVGHFRGRLAKATLLVQSGDCPRTGLSSARAVDEEHEPDGDEQQRQQQGRGEPKQARGSGGLNRRKFGGKGFGLVKPPDLVDGPERSEDADINEQSHANGDGGD